MFKIKIGKAPGYLRDLTPNNVEARTRYELRTNANMDIPPARIEAYSKSFFPATAHAWNTLAPSTRQLPSVEAFKYVIKKATVRTNPLYYFGERRVSIIHARLRVKCSLLKAHLFHELHVIDSPLCPCATGVEEDNEHFFFTCRLFTEQRNVMRASILNVISDWPPPIEHLLHGIPDQTHVTNIHVFSIVHQFIFQSKRFD
jgi:hypothetical protein